MSHNGTSLQSPLDFTDLDAFGKNNYSKELFDVKQIINWICDINNPYQKYINKEKIVLIGHSRGGGVSIIKASEDTRVKALVTWASISVCNIPWRNMNEDKMLNWANEGVIYYMNKRTGQKLPLYYQLYEDYLQNKSRLDIKKSISSLKIPVLICHGTQDTAVPYSSALDLVKASLNAELLTVDSDHVFGRSHPWDHDILPSAMQEVVNKTIDFLSKHVS